MDARKLVAMSAAFDGRRIDWSLWANISTVDVRDACLLSLNLSPDESGARSHSAHVEFLRREVIAKSHLGIKLNAYATESDRYYDRHASGVSLPEFRAWGESLPMPFAVRDPNGRAYNRTAHLAERRKMMQGWADYLDGLRTNANVVPIKRKA